MLNIQSLITPIQLTSAVCTPVAILATLIRLFVRRSVFGFDDGCALLSMLFVAAYMGIIVGPQSTSFANHFVVMGSMFYCTVWFARLSILLTIIRLSPEKQRQYLFFVVIVFFLLLGLLIAQLFWVCKHETNRNVITGCTPIEQNAIFKLVSDVIADLVLLLSSLRLFIVIQDKDLRFRLSCLFSTCVITTAVSLVNSCFVLKSEGLKIFIIAIVEANVSLIVTNIPVLSTVFSQVSKHTSRGSSRGEASSIVYFTQNAGTQVSRTNLFETGQTPDGSSTPVGEKGIAIGIPLQDLYLESRNGAAQNT